MKRRFLMAIILLLSVYPVYSDVLSTKPVLQTDESIGRTAPVLANTLMIRLKQGYGDETVRVSSGVRDNIRIIAPMLDKKLAIIKQKSRLSRLSSTKLQDIQSKEEPLLRTFIIEYDGNIPPEKYANYLIANNPEIEIAEPYYVYQTQSVPNDPMISEQRLFQVIEAFKGYEISKGSPNIIIAVSDNGIDQFHPDLYDNIAVNENEIPNTGEDNDNNGYIDDYIGYNFAYIEDGVSAGNTRHNDPHGTQVAGIVGANTNNGLGIAGVGYKCRIFPLKCASNNNPDGILYGYQSIIYAAVRGFSVINCSWGSLKPFSKIEQSIIDYAVANDVAIVAASGNTRIGVTRYDSFYPAAYKGVLGVGETDQVDNVVYSNTTLGVGARILAPGQGNLSINNYQGYETLGQGTSYSAPVVSGVVGIVRSHFPDLSARQALEWVRLRTDDITPVNFTERELIPGRVNLYKSLTGDPFANPAITLESFVATDTHLNEIERFNPNDTMYFHLNLKNHLGRANRLTFVLSNAYSFVENIAIIDSIHIVENIESGQEFVLLPFKLLLKSDIKQKTLFRVDIIGDNEYSDFFKFEFNTGLVTTTLANNAIRFSVGDIGTIGYDNSRREGVGFESIELGNQLYRGGVMATANDAVAFSSIHGSTMSNNDFTTTKPFIAPSNTGIIEAFQTVGSTDDNVIGLQVQREYVFPDANKPVVRSKLLLKNVGNVTLNKASVGYFYDWDISLFSSKNYVALLSEAIPPKYQETKNAAVQYAYSEDRNIFVGSIVYSDAPNSIAQAAGIDVDVIYQQGGFGKTDQIAVLSSGDLIQVQKMTDIAYVIGMQFNNTLSPGLMDSCYVCTAIANSRQKLAKLLRECADSTLVSVKEDDKMQASVYPNPASDFIYLPAITQDFISLQIVNSIGNIMLEHNNLGVAGKVDISNYPQGVYYLIINDNNELSRYKFIVVR